MINRRLLRWSLILLILAAFAVWLEPTRVVWGWLRGEAFYLGRPTSWWAEQIRPWQKRSRLSTFGTDGGLYQWYTFEATRSRFTNWLACYVQIPEPIWPAVLDGDPEAKAVLDELLGHGDSLVRDWAAEGRERIGTDAKGPTVCRVRGLGRPQRRVPGGNDGP
jgi:hypothetical protein